MTTEAERGPIFRVRQAGSMQVGRCRWNKEWKEVSLIAFTRQAVLPSTWLFAPNDEWERWLRLQERD